MRKWHNYKYLKHCEAQDAHNSQSVLSGITVFSIHCCIACSFDIPNFIGSSNAVSGGHSPDLTADLICEELKRVDATPSVSTIDVLQRSQLAILSPFHILHNKWPYTFFIYIRMCSICQLKMMTIQS